MHAKKSLPYSRKRGAHMTKKMRIVIYNEPAGLGVGGSELCAAMLAGELQHQHDVRLVHHRQGLNKDTLARLFDLELKGVSVQCEPVDCNWHGQSQLPWRRYAEERRWKADLSKGCDLFVTFTHGLPPFCHAAAGAMFIHFPLFNRLESWPWKNCSGKVLARLRRHLTCCYYDWSFRRRLETYQIKLVNSQFTQRWTRIRWGVDSAVLYPPVNASFSQRPKRELILSVGRLAPMKKQLEMLAAFKGLTKHVGGWSYCTAGGVSDDEYAQAVDAEARQSSATVIKDAGYSELRGLYEQASIFWHATGYGESDEIDPGKMEHFGITTVEAMAAGCVPVVINKGGQREIVEHGVTGFLWDTLDELKDYTLALVRDQELRYRISAAARDRARNFGRERFVKGFLQEISHYLK